MNKLALLLPLWLCAGGSAFAQPPISLPLTSAQVTCEEQQAGRLIHRLSVAYNGPSLYLWRSSPQAGAYRGLVTTNHLYFDPSTVQDILLCVNCKGPW